MTQLLAVGEIRYVCDPAVSPVGLLANVRCGESPQLTLQPFAHFSTDLINTLLLQILLPVSPVSS